MLVSWIRLWSKACTYSNNQELELKSHHIRYRFIITLFSLLIYTQFHFHFSNTYFLYHLNLVSFVNIVTSVNRFNTNFKLGQVWPINKFCVSKNYHSWYPNNCNFNIQDGTFLNNDPLKLIGFWFPLDDATLENGCLLFAPGSHRNKVSRRFIRNPNKGNVYFITNQYQFLLAYQKTLKLLFLI